MNGEIEDEKGLIADVRYALREAPILTRRVDRASDAWRDSLASKIVAHLKLANWIIRRGEPLKGWSGPPMRKND